MVRKVISAVKAVKLISQEAHGYIAYTRVEKKEVSKLIEVKMVKEYEDVFPEELLGLSSS